MEQNFSSTKFPTSVSLQVSIAGKTWSNGTNIEADDGNLATLLYAIGGDSGANITGFDFGFQQLPDEAVIDGVEIFIDGGNVGCGGEIELGITGTTNKDIGGLNGSYGGATDLWGLSSIDPSDISSIYAKVITGDLSGGDGYAEIDYMTITVYWHIEVANTEADVPTRIDYKVYTRDGDFLGLLPNVTTDLVFPEDINTAGTSIQIECGSYADNAVTVSPLLTEAGATITTESDEPIYATETDLLIAPGGSDDEAIFKNSNRVKAWMYNKYYPNGKLMFSGQINKVNFKYGGGSASVVLTVLSDGLDMNNFVSRGFPFSYTNDVSQTTNDNYVTVSQDAKGGGWQRYGQTWKVGAGVDNLGAFVLKLQGTADVTLAFYDSPTGSLIGSTSKSVANGSFTDVQFETPQLIDVTALEDYFVAISVEAGQSIKVRTNSTDAYADGSLYTSTFGGGGGGGYTETTGDLYFISKSGEPTTTATYTSDDPVTDMASGILEDYNARGGMVTEGDFEATGLSLTYTFVMSFIHDAITKILELCPSGYYAYVDVGAATIDLKATSATADYTVVRGKSINELNIELSIEQVKNYLLLTGGDTGGGSNLYRDYKDSQSASNFGLRTIPKSDNRITLADTADAIGSTFIEENADELQNTTLAVINDVIDITLLTPGTTIGFKNFGNFIDDLILQVVRREGNYSKGIAYLTLGRLPVRMTNEIQKINRELLNEQTINNPTAPS